MRIVRNKEADGAIKAAGLMFLILFVFVVFPMIAGYLLTSYFEPGALN